MAADTDLDRAIARIARMESELGQFRLRVGALEEFVNQRFDPPHVPRARQDSGAAVELGAALSETKREVRQAKDSARNLRRLVSPENDTGQHELPESERPWKK